MQDDEEKSEEARTELRRIGPQLASDAMAPSTGIGPALPEHIVRARMAVEAARKEVEDESMIDVGAIGPLLPGNEIVEELRHTSGLSKAASCSPPNKLEHESWMTDYLPVSSNPLAALKPRKFRQGAAPAGRIDSSWFTISGSKSSEAASSSAVANIPQPDLHSKFLQDVVTVRDNAMLAVANEYNKNHSRDESLLERHQRKLAQEAAKAKKKTRIRRWSGSSSSNSSSNSSSSSSEYDSSSFNNRKRHKRRHHKRHKKSRKKDKKKKSKNLVEGPTPTRQPFDRDRDLLASRVDPLKRLAIIERSKNFGSRFTHGEQKFL